ncbi:uncharacterized protein RHOBADRAFT_66775, partial [Rhodotorula graminis WP1]
MPVALCGAWETVPQVNHLAPGRPRRDRSARCDLWLGGAHLCHDASSSRSAARSGRPEKVDLLTSSFSLPPSPRLQAAPVVWAIDRPLPPPPRAALTSPFLPTKPGPLARAKSRSASLSRCLRGRETRLGLFVSL